MKNMRRLTVPFIIALVFLVAFQLFRMGTVVNWTQPTNIVSSLNFDNRIEKEEPLINSNTFIIYQDNSVLSEKLLEKTENALNYVKKDYTVLSELTIGVLENVDLLIVTTGELEKIGDLQVLIDYIDDGGDVLFLTTFSSGISLNSIKRNFGIYEYGDTFTSTSFDIEAGFINEKNMVVEETPWISQSLNVRLLDSCNIYIRDSSGKPILWEYTAGNGKVMISNGNYLVQEGCMGLLVNIVTHFDEISLYPIINAGVFVLEGYPVSMEGTLEWLTNNYSRDIEGFVRDLWWPDMMKVADSNGIKYTGGMYGINRLETEPPFSVNGHEVSTFAYYGIDLIQQGNELAISGYSPVALITEQDDYDNVQKWTIKNLDESLEYIQSFSDKSFNDYEIRSFIAPSGILTETSLESVKKQLNPSIITVALEGNDQKQLVKSFKVEEDIVWFPIISEECKVESYGEFLISSFGNSMGVLSHQLCFWEMVFANNSMGETLLWEDILKDYTKFAKQIKEDYSWMDFVTISAAAQKQIDQDSLDLYYEFKDGKLIVTSNGSGEEMSFMLKTDKIVKPSEDYAFDKIDDTHYLITVSSNNFSIILEDK